MVKILRE
jgi:hypothetical protein